MPIELQNARNTGPSPAALIDRPLPAALLQGMRLRCPACSQGSLFRGYLKVAEACPHCSEPLHHQRADDAPAYFTMVVVGHVIVAGLLIVEKLYAPPTWVQLAIWLPLTLLMSLALLPVVKGMLVALQWALRMHGFGAGPDPAAPVPITPRSANPNAAILPRGSD